MLDLLLDYKGSLEVNGKTYSSVQAAIKDLGKYSGTLEVKLNSNNLTLEDSEAQVKPKNYEDTIYQVKVKQYMTKPASSDFDFHRKWNNDIPMPLRVMVGKVIDETPGMLKMELHGEIVGEITPVCMKCGKSLSNKVSQYFGMGPECGGHNYIHPFESDEELKAAIADQNKKLMDIKWTGWIIKKAIEYKEEI